MVAEPHESKLDQFVNRQLFVEPKVLDACWFSLRWNKDLDFSSILYYHGYLVCECWTVGWTFEDATLGSVMEVLQSDNLHAMRS